MKKKNVITVIALSVMSISFCFVTGAYAGEKIVLVRTAEDSGVKVDSFCKEAPFPVNVRLGAKVWSHATRASDGEVVNDQIHEVGTAQACALITDPKFTPFSDHPFYIRFDLKDESYTGLGHCTVATNDVPEKGLVLVGCTLQLSLVSDGTPVGIATSSSVFNPSRIPGFETGSYWSLRTYTRDK